MGDRVLSTPEAKSAIQQIRHIIDGGLSEQLAQLDSQGQKLCEKNVWDGPLADQFSNSTWPQTKAALEKAKSELDSLQAQLDKISQNIFSAGGA